MAKSLMKQNLFSLNNNALLHNRGILYFVFLLSLGNLFYLLMERDITTIVVFLIVGFLTSFFSKNMMVILFVAVAVGNILKYGANIRNEGLENMAGEEDKEYQLEGMEDGEDGEEEEVEGMEDGEEEEEEEEEEEVKPKKKKTKAA